MLRSLTSLFQPPRYLSMAAVGVDISDTSLKYVQFAPTLQAGGERRLTAWGEVEIPAGTLVQGEIREPNQLVAVLKECKAKTGTEYVRVSLPEERAYIFETEIKRTVPYNEVRSLLEFKLEENVPIPSREVMFDFAILPTDAAKHSVRVVVAAYARETIQTYYEACLQAGVLPLAFEVEAQAMARALIPSDINGAVMLVDFGKTRTGVGVVHRGQLLFTSTIDIGGSVLSQAMRKVLGNVPESELTQIKNTKGLIRSVDSSEMYDTLIATVSVVKDEIATRMQYWHAQSGNRGERRIQSVILCGGSSNLRGLPEYLRESLSVPVLRGNVWENVYTLEHTVPPIDMRHSFGYATAIGLALAHTI